MSTTQSTSSSRYRREVPVQASQDVVPVGENEIFIDARSSLDENDGASSTGNGRPQLGNRQLIRPPEKLEAHFVEFHEPTTYSEAVSEKNATEWQNAIREELDAYEKNGTWSIVQLPAEKRTIDSRWVFKVKRSPSGDIQR